MPVPFVCFFVVAFFFSNPVMQTGYAFDQNNAGRYALDACGRKSSVTDPLGHVTTWTYYGVNEPAAASGGNPNCAGWLKSVTAPGPDVSKPTVTTQYANYDVMGRLAQTINPKAYAFFSGYDAAGNLTGQTDGAQANPNAQPQAHSMRYGYDTLGRKAYVANPADPTKKERWTYDDSGNVATYTNYAGAVCTYQYDGRNRCTGIGWNDGNVTPPTGYFYDAASRVTEVLNWHADIHYTYDDSGAVVTEQQQIFPNGPPLTTTYHHDMDGNVSSIQYPGGKTPTFEYDKAQRCNRVTLNNSGMVYYQYGGTQLKSRQCGNGINTLYEYDHGRIVKINELRYENYSSTFPGSYLYGHAPNGQLSWWCRQGWTDNTRVGGMETGRGDAFFYDLDGSMINAARDITPTNGNWPSPYGDSSLGNNISYANPSALTNDYGYVYDAAGNRTKVTPYVSPTSQPSATYAPAKGDNEYQSVTQGSATNSFLYDGNYNLKSAGPGWRFTYDAENHLARANQLGTNASAVFNYDGLGRLVEQAVGGKLTHFYYAGSQRIEERDGANGEALVYSYLFDGPGADSILCRTDAAGSRLWYQADVLGNTVHLSDDGGHLVEQYLYDAYGAPSVYDGAGNLRAGGSAYDNRYLFKGSGAYEWLPALGLYYARARFYWPQHGRWLQPDPVGQAGGLNVYTYCGNDPVNGIDSSGLEAGSIDWYGNHIEQSTGAGLGNSPWQYAFSARAEDGLMRDVFFQAPGTAGSSSWGRGFGSASFGNSAAVAYGGGLSNDPSATINNVFGGLASGAFHQAFDDAREINRMLTSRMIPGAGYINEWVLNKAEEYAANAGWAMSDSVGVDPSSNAFQENQGGGAVAFEVAMLVAGPGEEKALATSCFAAGTSVSEPSGKVNIESVRVGDRVFTRSQGEDGDDASNVDPQTWKEIVLHIPNSECPWNVDEVHAIRSPQWMTEAGCRKRGDKIWFQMSEVGIQGWAEVESITDCPPLAPGNGHVVLTTFNHFNNDLYELSVEGETKPIEVTGLHRLYSTIKNDWVQSRFLHIGEGLRTHNGERKVVKLDRKPGIYRVYNLEVETDHCYFVSDAQVLAHNAGCMTPDQQALKRLVNEVTNGGRTPLSRADANTVLEWGQEINYPGLRAGLNDVASPSNWTANPVPHIHVPGAGRNGHVPVEPGVTPIP